MTNQLSPHTGSYLSSKLGTREDMARYAQGWDRIFGAKNKENVTVTDNSVMNTLYDRYYIQAENEYLDKLEEEADEWYDVKNETYQEE